MFERRLKIFLLLLFLATGALALRAAQIQWIQHRKWQKAATEAMKQTDFIETTRGAILDRLGRTLAYDAPCIDACVDYRAITDEPDAAWVRKRAVENLHDRLGSGFRDATRAADWNHVADQECAHVRAGIAAMWAELARVSNQTPDQIDQVRRDIVAQVEMHRRYVWWQSYQRATGGDEKSATWYQQLLEGAGGDAEIDKFKPEVREQESPHVILHAIDADVQADLARQQETFYGLSLLPSKRREYPFGRSACHLLGRVVRAAPEQFATDNSEAQEQGRQWHDMVGQGGIEGLCERTLGGLRGRVVHLAGQDEPISTQDPVPGQDVHTTIDIELESDCEQAFMKPRTHTDSDNVTETRADQHGALVIEKIDTGEVLAMVSNPGYDPNTLDVDYPMLARDDLNLPLLNRATQMAVEPGSTVKPIVGSGAITDGIMTPTSTIQCRGVLVIDGKPQAHGHCWIFKLWEKHKAEFTYPSHNFFPSGNLPNDELTVSDGLERSCNVVFETIADRMRMPRLCYWFRQFGLGEPTGIGIDESPGRLFRPGHDVGIERVLSWSAGIGEGVVHATPLQMADVAATVARNGIWMRPRLVDPSDVGPATTQPNPDGRPNVMDLHLSPDAIAAVKKGMFNVVNGDAGTGWGVRPDQQAVPDPQDPLYDIKIAGKTGTAQSSALSIPRRDKNGAIVKDADGKVIYDKVPVGTPGTETWYKSIDNNYDHAWFIGYAPADHPQIAFAVFVEYGEAGSRVAGAIAHDALEACVRHGYLSASP